MSQTIMAKIHFVKSGKMYHRLKMTEVDYVYAEGNYSTFFTSHSKHIAKISLKQVGEILPPADFIRVHRNYIIRYDKIDKIDTQNNKVLLGENFIPIGRSFKGKLLKEIRVLG